VFTLIILGLIILSSLNVSAAQVGTLYNLGYTFGVMQLGGGQGPIDFNNNPYSYRTPQNSSIGELVFEVPYNVPGEILYFNLLLADGSSHKGFYEDMGNDNYQLMLDDKSILGNFTYGTAEKFEQSIGQYHSNRVQIDFASVLNDRTTSALYIYADSNYIINGGMPYFGTVIAIPLSNNYDLLTGFSASITQTNANAQAYYYVDTNTNLYGAIAGAESGAANSSGTIVANNGVPTSFMDLINKFINPLISIGTALIELMLLVFMILRLLIDPYNIMLILLLFEEFAAIMALSAKGDILVSMKKFSMSNQTMFNFIIMASKGMIQVMSLIVQALASAVQAGATIAQAGATAISGIVGWLITLIAIIPK